jgi:activator of HSP90 ATPase
MSNIIYNISNEYLQVAHKIARALVKEQQRIEDNAGKKGIATELGKLITYLDTKIQQNINLKKEDKKPLPLNFFEYLEQLAEHSKTTGYSQKTVDYYKSINETVNTCLREYAKKPRIMQQILGWSQRLMSYYLLDTSKLDDEIDSLQIDDDDEPITFIPPSPKSPKASNESESTATITKAPSNLQSPPKPKQPTQQSTQTGNSPTLNRPTPPKPAKSVESPKLEKPKAPEPKKPWERPPQAPNK